MNHNHTNFSISDSTLNIVYNHYPTPPSFISFNDSVAKKISDLESIVEHFKLIKKEVLVHGLYISIEMLFFDEVENVFIRFNKILTKDATKYLPPEYCEASIFCESTIDPLSLNIYNKVNSLPSIVKSPINNIYLVSQTSSGLYLTPFAMKESNKIDIDIDLNYNDDFKPIHELVTDRINNSNKGIILFHGLPGTGKTSYIKWFLQNTPKKIIFLPPYLTTQLASPNFITFIANSCANSLLVIEDAEEVLRSRDGHGNAAISNLLNISDGLLSDIFNVQILATFNCKITEIDEALRRKGRIIAEYEFKHLRSDKAQKLSNKLGFDTFISTDTLLTDIFNQKEKDFKKKPMKRVGFVAS